MKTIATLGPKGSDGYQAAVQFDANAEILLYNHIADIMSSVTAASVDYALVPVYNTREGEVKEYFRLMEKLEDGYWFDNVVLPIHLSLGTIKPDQSRESIDIVSGRSSVFRQCEEYIATHMPHATLVSVRDLDSAITNLKEDHTGNHALIETEEVLNRYGLHLVDRELVPYNRTRFAVIGKRPHNMSGYDATSIITRPLPDRVGLLVDTLNEFTRRGINILDLRSENDVRTQKLQIYLEVEGHRDTPLLAEALENIERRVIQERNCLKILGSFPRVDMRVKKIKSVGFIGSGAMSKWFADQLEREGYKTVITGRSTELSPREMIPDVDVVLICVPISATAGTVGEYADMLRDGQALILLAGESEKPLQLALQQSSEGVEIMLVHNLWGPKAVTMKDKNVAVVRTRRSGSLCSEFESFLYKFGAEIYHDSAAKHDLLMGVSQKLPTSISVALAMTLSEHQIDFADLDAHSTLTSLYGVLSMARVHNQHSRTYAEIMASGGTGNSIVKSFISNLQKLFNLAESKEITVLADIIEENKNKMPKQFLTTKMSQAQAIDAVLSDIGFKGD